jgi:hypothetical protein
MLRPFIYGTRHAIIIEGQAWITPVETQQLVNGDSGMPFQYNLIRKGGSDVVVRFWRFPVHRGPPPPAYARARACAPPRAHRCSLPRP